jgi:Asp-tRNA(Asn)/Glu-tRNA(Gln) amidotransferase A subunit family amidase
MRGFTDDVASLVSPEASDYVFMLSAARVVEPAVTVPMAFDGALPIGVQLIGRKWEDTTVLSAARVVEQAVIDTPE